MHVTHLKFLSVLAISVLAGCSFFGGYDDEGYDAVESTPAPAPTPSPEISVAPMSKPAPQPVTVAQSSGTRIGQRVTQLSRELNSIEAAHRAQRSQSGAARTRSRESARQYHILKGGIVARLQVGTTPGNPELVGSWNSAQDSLDSLSNEINQMASLAAVMADNAATANFLLDTIRATYTLSGAVEEDHERLQEVEDGTREILVPINSSLSELRDDITRQTTFVANERASLNSLRDAIKRGELFGPGLSAASAPFQQASYQPGAMQSSTPLVVIRFDRPGVRYEEALYSALAQALEQRPGASFDVVAVSPTQGNAADLALAQSAARDNASQVLDAMRDMGLPGNRLALSSSARADAASSEVHVFVR